MDNPAERKARASLPFLRWMQSGLPLPLASRLLKWSVTRLRLAAGVTRESISADGVACEWISAQPCQQNRVLLYLHGGGFVFGLTPLHLHLAATLAKKMEMRVLMVDYRLAPKHAFPAALDDCVTAYGWLLKQGFSARNIVIAGDSAGGNLTITSMMKLRDSGIPLPAAAACLSPVTDLTEKDNQDHNFKDPLLPPKAMKFYTRAYLDRNDPRQPLISPVFGDLHRLPPLLIHVGEEEILRQDALSFAQAVKASGGELRLEIYPRMWHVFQLYSALPQAVHSLEDISQFLMSHMQPGE